MTRLSEQLTALADRQVALEMFGPWTNLTRWQQVFDGWSQAQMDPMAQMSK